MVRLKPLTRLRLGFLVLGALLLGPLGLLWSTANQRLETQRRLRHEVVGERIFDELERELTDLLDRESRRPSLAYDAPTSADSWAPFVVGYFTVGRAGPEVLAKSELAPERRRRMAWALARWEKRPGAAGPAAEPSREMIPERSQAEGKAQPATPAPAPAAMPKRAATDGRAAPRSSPDILKQLNRAGEVRQQRAPAASKNEHDMLAY
ncbi:MAG: hypothetical protein JW940_08630 [Polyangiaceae bacterium]|nr:hypothetical protein [Polyangiaceae bacterium]